MSERSLDRATLRGIFGEGMRPSANNFGSLIDSMVNKVDDRISKSPEDGLMLAPEGMESDRVISFFDDIQSGEFWHALSTKQYVTLKERRMSCMIMPYGDNTTKVDLAPPTDLSRCCVFSLSHLILWDGHW